MHAGRMAEPREGREFLDFGDPRYVRMHGREPVPVELTEDPEGPYYGWIDSPDWKWGYGHGDGSPVMIQPHDGMFRMQSPDGFVQDVQRGYGEIVRMTCRAIDEG
jgi:hypothetical protein